MARHRHRRRRGEDTRAEASIQPFLPLPLRLPYSPPPGAGDRCLHHRPLCRGGGRRAAGGGGRRQRGGWRAVRGRAPGFKVNGYVMRSSFNFLALLSDAPWCGLPTCGGRQGRHGTGAQDAGVVPASPCPHPNGISMESITVRLLTAFHMDGWHGWGDTCGIYLGDLLGARTRRPPASCGHARGPTTSSLKKRRRDSDSAMHVSCETHRAHTKPPGGLRYQARARRHLRHPPLQESCRCGLELPPSRSPRVFMRRAEP